MRNRATMLLLCGLLFLPVLLLAQTQPLHITSVSPVGAARGTTVTVTMEGMNIGVADGIRIDGAGITASSIQSTAPNPPKNTNGKITVSFTIAPDAPTGRRAFRLTSPLGASDVGYFVVDKYPVVEEKEPNNTRETAQAVNIASPITFVGKIDPGEDVDYLTFTGKKGQTFIADVQAARIGSALDSVLVLQDAKGREIAQNEDYFGSDSFLAYPFPADGIYFLKLYDLRYQGGGGHYYRLALGIIPNVLTGVFPGGGMAGTNATFDLFGYNLPPSGKVVLPLAQTDTPTITSTVLSLGGDTAYNSVRIQTGTLPEIRETEPNDTPQTAQRVTVPVVINGQIYHSNIKTGGSVDRDFFRFRAEKGKPLNLEVTARRLGSPMDSMLTLYDKNGKEITSNDDAEGKDSRLDFTPPETDDYIVQVSELTQRSGANFVYRLCIAPPVPDFSLSFSPDNLTLGAGDRIPVRVTAERRFGFNEPIAISVISMLKELQILNAAQIPAGSTETTLILTTNATGKQKNSHFSLQGTANRNGKSITRIASPLEEFYTKNGDQIVRNTRLAVLPHLSLNSASDLIVSLSSENLTINQGKTAELTVKVIRSEGFKAKIPLLFTGLPQGVSITPAEIPENQSEVKVTIKAEGNAALGSFPIICTARVVFDELHFTSHLAPILTLTVSK